MVAEGAVIGALSWALAAAAAWPVSRAIGSLMTAIFKVGLDFSFEPIGLAVWAAVSLFLGRWLWHALLAMHGR